MVGDISSDFELVDWLGVVDYGTWHCTEGLRALEEMSTGVTAVALDTDSTYSFAE